MPTMNEVQGQYEDCLYKINKCQKALLKSRGKKASELRAELKGLLKELTVIKVDLHELEDNV